MYHSKCNQLLNEPEIRFAGIIDKDGKLISGGFKQGITPHEGDETRLQSFMEFVSKASIRKEYDESLGPINYLAARRDKAVLVSFPFPISRILLLVSAEPTVNVESLAKKVVTVFTDVGDSTNGPHDYQLDKNNQNNNVKKNDSAVVFLSNGFEIDLDLLKKKNKITFDYDDKIYEIAYSPKGIDFIEVLDN